MAQLKPNNTYTLNGVAIKEKIIPDGTRWKNASKAVKAGFSANALYKKERKLTNSTGKALFVTIHNTNDLGTTQDDGEQYTRATYNENMNSVRVHFYVDELGAWQNLKAGTGKSKNDPEGSAEVSWHAGDGSVADGGNMTSLSLEIIMNDTAEHDANAKDNGARLAAWLLWKHELPIDRLVTHTYWVNKAAGKTFGNVDEQCANPVKGKKWCPTYIFNSTDPKNALANWKAFKKLVQTYLNALDPIKETITKSDTPAKEVSVIEKNDLVSLLPEAVYYSGKTIPAWVKKQNWYVKEVKGDRAVIDKNEAGTNAICSPVNTRYLQIVKKTTVQNESQCAAYRVKITTDSLKIRKGAGTNYACVGYIKDKGVYTIVAEQNGSGVSKWGKLKSGAGWISLDYTKKL